MAPARVADRAHAAIIGLGAALTVAYWIEWFTQGRVKSGDDEVYLTHQASFPLADGYAAVMAALAARALWKQRESAVGLGLAAGSAYVFLGLMDLLFNLRRGSLRDRTPEAGIERTIIGLNLTLGPLTMLRLWRARHRLAGASQG
jgi:UDP-N-acetylmuramyl pentapeptide phosphotransferase/UDP-N-acetylglucosamine-1-phosphate transferase